MSDITIEKSVPLPHLGRKHLYPFGDMEVGDSFLVPVAKHSAVYGSASYYGKRNKQKFAVRKLVEKGKPVARCWRVK